MEITHLKSSTKIEFFNGVKLTPAGLAVLDASKFQIHLTGRELLLLRILSGSVAGDTSNPVRKVCDEFYASAGRVLDSASLPKQLPGTLAFMGALTANSEYRELV